jgi:adenylate kinase family enzyme
MLREEVASRTPLGREVADIMARGDLVSSAVVTALMRRRMRRHPGRRILLDGFPRSLENARDFVELCGPPELALHLNCDDTVMIERILSRGAAANSGGGCGGGGDDDGGDANVAGAAAARSDDNVHTAIQRLKNYHKHHNPTMSWLKEIRVPIVELDCSGTKEDVWGQLTAIGRLMRPAVKLPVQQQQQQQQQRPTTSDDEIVVVLERTQQPPMQEVVYGGVQRNDAEEDMRWFA